MNEYEKKNSSVVIFYNILPFPALSQHCNKLQHMSYDKKLEYCKGDWKTHPGH